MRVVSGGWHSPTLKWFGKTLILNKQHPHCGCRRDVGCDAIRKSLVQTDKFTNFVFVDPLNQYRIIINGLCDTYHVDKLYAFGSILTNKFNESSDIDLLVKFQTIDLLKYSDNYYNFKFSLEDLFHRPVDLLEEQALKNPYLKQSIDESKELIYG